jgi:hypothetical protein
LVIFLNRVPDNTTLLLEIKDLFRVANMRMFVLYTNLARSFAERLETLWKDAGFPQAHSLIALEVNAETFIPTLEKLHKNVLKYLTRPEEEQSVSIPSTPPVTNNTPSAKSKPLINVPETQLSNPTSTNSKRPRSSQQPLLVPYLKDILYTYIEPPVGRDPLQSPPMKDHDAVRGVTTRGVRWAMAAASIRGRSHQQKGTYRDDAFKIAHEGNWHILAVADGAGSAEWSRVTANASVRVAVETLKRHARPVSDDPQEAGTRMKRALQDAIRKVHSEHESQTRQLNAKKNQTYATFLLVVHQPFPDGSCLVGTIHVGDGLIVGANDDEFIQLTTGEHGSDASTTYFVLSFTADELANRVQVGYRETPFTLIGLMTDGIEDDLKPSTEDYKAGARLEQNTEDFIRSIQQHRLIWPCYEDWGEILQEEISYERTNSNDDRTLAILLLQNNLTDEC